MTWRIEIRNKVKQVNRQIRNLSCMAAPKKVKKFEQTNIKKGIILKWGVLGYPSGRLYRFVGVELIVEPL